MDDFLVDDQNGNSYDFLFFKKENSYWKDERRTAY